MFSKRIVLSAALVLILSGAMAGFRWWKNGSVVSTDEGRMQPPAVEELRKLMGAYARAGISMDVSGTIRIYDREAKDLLKETRTFRYARSGPGYYAQLSYLQTFCDGAMVVQLDTVHRTIVVGAAPAPGTAATPDALLSIIPLDALFSDTAQFRTIGLVSLEGRERRLRLKSELHPELASSTLVYDTLSYRLNRAEMEWRKQGGSPDEKDNRIWLAKIEYRYAPAQKSDIREKIRTIVTVSAGKVTTTAGYRDYALQLNNN